MIFIDDDGITNIEYGHGSVMGFVTEFPDENAHGYSLSSTDKHPIGEECKNFHNLEGKLDSSIGVSVRFKFLNLESLDILIDGLKEVRKAFTR